MHPERHFFIWEDQRIILNDQVLTIQQQIFDQFMPHHIRKEDPLSILSEK